MYFKWNKAQNNDNHVYNSPQTPWCWPRQTDRQKEGKHDPCIVPASFSLSRAKN